VRKNSLLGRLRLRRERERERERAKKYLEARAIMRVLKERHLFEEKEDDFGKLFFLSLFFLSLLLCFCSQFVLSSVSLFWHFCCTCFTRNCNCQNIIIIIIIIIMREPLTTTKKKTKTKTTKKEALRATLEKDDAPEEFFVKERIETAMLEVLEQRGLEKSC